MIDKITPRTRLTALMQAPISLLALLFVVALLAGCASLGTKASAEIERLKDRYGDLWHDAGDDTPGGTESPDATLSDAIDPTTIRYLHGNVSAWPITSALSVSLGSTVSLSYDKATQWPAIDGLNANPWIIVKVDGQWTAATFEWFRKGQTSKPSKTVAGDHIKRSPLHDFRPVSGETYGWMVTTLARDAKRTLNERTNIVFARWP